MRPKKKIKLRMAAQIDITREMVEYGPDRDWSILWRSRYPNVKKPTWYRWVNEIKSGGVAARKAAEVVKAKADRDKQLLPRENTEQRIIENLPELVRPGDVANTGFVPVMNEIQRAIDRANHLMDYCESDNGQIRNPKLYLMASRHVLESLRTAAQVSNQLMDAQQTERFHQAIIESIMDVDRELAERVIRRLKDLNISWGCGLAF